MADVQQTRQFTLRVRRGTALKWAAALYCERFGWLLIHVSWTRDGSKFILSLTFTQGRDPYADIVGRRRRVYPTLPLSLLTKSLKTKLLGHK